jgi:hypothetical protein
MRERPPDKGPEAMRHKALDEMAGIWPASLGGRERMALGRFDTMRGFFRRKKALFARVSGCASGSDHGGRFSTKTMSDNGGREDRVEMRMMFGY